MIVIPSELDRTWVVFTYRPSNSCGRGERVIIENNFILMIEVSLRFEFSTTNNQAEYEALIVGVMLAGK